MSEQKDYDTLEWLDCKNNVPPMNIDLYVDSEHGYGIGRLGRRVKDKSIIWTVHLDSGEVYLVYAFYKVKRWAYMPKDEKNNTKLKHELKAVHAFDVYEAYTKTGDDDAAQVYLKSEADKVIADLEESHKKEVGQLLIEISELKKERDWLAKDRALACNDLEKRAQLNIQKDAEICRLKKALYKACSNWARSERYTEATWHGDEHREELWAEVEQRCRAMADKFKEAK